jgi:hypothetical protein
MTEPYFASLDAFRAHCGEPTMPLDQCPICSKIPDRAYRFEKGGDVETDSVPPEIKQLVQIVGEYSRAGVVLQCPTCRRIYLHKYDYEFIYGGSEDTDSYERLDIEDAFRSEWMVRQRLDNNTINWVIDQNYFAHNAIVRFNDASGWFAVDENNQRHELTRDTLTRLIERERPTGLDKLDRARHYAHVIDDIVNPRDHTLYGSIDWKKELTEEEQHQVADVEAASGRISGPEAEHVGDHIVVRKWVTSEKRLICRVITIERSGAFTIEDAVIAENLPIR